MYKLTDTQFSSSINVIGSYTITAAGRYKIQMRGGFWSASPGGLTANVYYNKGISLTIKTIPGGWGCGTSVGIGLWAGGTAPVLVAGGGGYADTRDNCGGGGYVGGGIYWGINPNYHSAASGYSWNGSQGANMSTSGVGTGGSDWCCSNHYNTHSGYGGSGYCGSGYSCSNGSGINYSGEERYIQRRARIIITYCGPNSNSACP